MSGNQPRDKKFNNTKKFDSVKYLYDSRPFIPRHLLGNVNKPWVKRLKVESKSKSTKFRRMGGRLFKSSLISRFEKVFKRSKIKTLTNKKKSVKKPVEIFKQGKIKTLINKKKSVKTPVKIFKQSKIKNLINKSKSVEKPVKIFKQTENKTLIDENESAKKPVKVFALKFKKVLKVRTKFKRTESNKRKFIYLKKRLVYVKRKK